MASRHQVQQQAGLEPLPEHRAGRWLPLAAVLTLVMFGWLGWHAYSTFQIARTIKSAYVQSETLRDRICELEQRLLVAAVMAVGTGGVNWHAEHGELQRRLSAAIRAALDTLEPGHDRDALDRIEQAHGGLRAVEARALAMAATAPQAALQLLAAHAYQEQVNAFSAATNDFIERYRDHLDRRLRHEGTKEVASLVTAFLIFGGSLAAWLVLGYRLERWRSALVTEMDRRVRLENQLLQARKMEALGQLASGIAHDFDNLLIAIKGYADLARTTPNGRDVAGGPLQKLRQAVAEAEGMTRALLTFARRAEPQLEALNLRSILFDLRNLLEGTLPGSVTLHQEAPEDLWVRGDRGQLMQALLNLAINARDAMPRGGRLAIRLDRAAGTDLTVTGSEAPPLARIRVQDSGAGMTAEVLEKAFDPFFTTHERGRGTGLGLSLVHGVVTAHGGTVAIESQPGEGTTVTLLLPLVPAPLRADPPGKAAPPRTTSTGASILVAAAQVYVREILSGALRGMGHRVTAVAGGAELLTVAGGPGAAFDLCIIDASLPGRDGIDCLIELRNRGWRAPVILMAEEIDAALEDRVQGAALVLHKPVGMDVLTRLVPTLLLSRSGP